MASFNGHPRSTFSAGPNQPAPLTGPLPLENSSTGPLPTITDGWPGQAADSTSSLSPAITRHLSFQPTPGATRALTGTLPRTPVTTSLRTPVVIKGNLKVAAPKLPISHKKRRLLVSLFGTCMFFLVVSLTLFTVTPLGRDMGLGFDPMKVGSNLVNGQNTSQGSLAAQATAVYFQTHDGYDPYVNGSQIVGNGSSSLSWPPGQCTYWANLRYHEKTGYWVRWYGNADAWVTGAKLAGWHVWLTPHIPSIIVLMAGVQSAGSWGHVAVVESINADGSAHTSNMNWGPFSTTHVEYVDFTPGPGVYFIGHP